MSAHATRAALETVKAPPRARGFLQIVRHGVGPGSMYVVTYLQVERQQQNVRPVLAQGAQALIDLLERIGVDFRLQEVGGPLQEILRLDSANIPDLWLSDEEMLEKGLVET